MDKIAPAFIAAKREFAPLLKDKANPAFRSKYADLGACIDSVEDALLKHDIAVFHETSDDQTGVTVECVLLHTSGETIRGGRLHVPAAKQDPQGYGSALTYARRYSLMAVCGIAPEDDDGNAASRPKQRAEPPRMVIAATEGIADEIAPARRAELEELALSYIASWNEGKTLKVIKHFYTLANEEQVYMTKLLQSESKMRAEIKANSPHKQAA